MTSPQRRLSDRIIRTQADLEEVWRLLMEPLGFDEGSLWLMALDADGRPTRQMLEIQDDGPPPRPDDVVSFGEMLRLIGEDAAPGVRWAMLRSRPGSGAITAADRGLIGALLASCRAAGVPTEVAHLASDEDLVPVPYDELAASA
ncbi:hypothetical protein BH11ACT8_BH11ACT8_15870 [soil metagenome]